MSRAQASLRDWDSGAHYAVKQDKQAAQRFRAREYEQRISREQVGPGHGCVCVCVCVCVGVDVPQLLLLLCVETCRSCYSIPTVQTVTTMFK
jgi:hypothetical protein